MTAVFWNGIEKGKYYGFWYWAWNAIGYGSFSDIFYIKAAYIPSKPPAPVVVGFSDSTIDLELFYSLDSGGMVVTDYYLEIAPKSTMAWTDVTTYQTNSMATTHQLKILDDNLVYGEIYYFRLRSKNAIGYSDYSDELACKIALNSLPPKMLNPPVVLWEFSDSTSLYFSWDLQSDLPTSPKEGGFVKGYEL